MDLVITIISVLGTVCRTLVISTVVLCGWGTDYFVGVTTFVS